MKIYKTRYLCKKEWPAHKVIKVCGGYKPMTSDDYKIWKGQK